MDQTGWNELKSRPAFDWLIEARRYLHAAEVLRASNEYQRGLVMTPTLHLLAHGTELLLKATLIAGGVSAKEARTYGHNIWELWSDSRNAQVKIDVLKSAEEEWSAAKLNPAWKDTFSEDCAILVEQYLKRLSELHNNETDFAIRYVRPEETEAPKPHLLGPTMYRVADHYVRDMTNEISSRSHA